MVFSGICSKGPDLSSILAAPYMIGVPSSKRNFTDRFFMPVLIAVIGQ